MLASTVVGRLPLRIDDRAFSDLDDAITRTEPNDRGSLDQINMSPLIAVIVDVVRDLAQENPLRAVAPGRLPS